MVEDNYLKKLREDKLAVKMAILSAKGEELEYLKKKEELIKKEMILVMIDKEMEQSENKFISGRKR